MQRTASEGTVQISTPFPGPAAPPQPGAGPAPAAPPPQAGPAPTVVAPAAQAAAPPPPRPAPAAPAAPAAPRPASASEGATEYVDVRHVISSHVVGVLVAVDGELEGEVFRVFDGENKLGRGQGCEILMPSKKISREHAKLIHQDGVFAIAPLSDQNPTLVNDEPTEGAELKDGDFVRVGRTTLRFRSVV